MIASSKAKHPPSKYSVGDYVLVRRFNSKSRKVVGRGLIQRHSRIVKGKITRTKPSRNMYKVQYHNITGNIEEKWYPVADITSLTRKQERKRDKVSTFKVLVVAI